MKPDAVYEGWVDPLDYYSATFLQQLNNHCHELKNDRQEWTIDPAPKNWGKIRANCRNRLDIPGEVL
jgi:hypothetical protein